MSIQSICPSEALQLLLEGNQRFVQGLRSVENFATTERLRELASKEQSPFAIVLTCSDSRVPTETIFDRGFGDIFVIRIAGNIISPSIIGSIEFAASNFGTPLCVVMGHSQCGAVKAAVKHEITDKDHPSIHVGAIVRKVRPAVKAVARVMGYPQKSLDIESLIHRSTIENIRRSEEALIERSPVIAELVKNQKLQIVGAHYDLYTGVVDFEPQERISRIKDHNDQTKTRSYRDIESA